MYGALTLCHTPSPDFITPVIPYPPQDETVALIPLSLTMCPQVVILLKSFKKATGTLIPVISSTAANKERGHAAGIKIIETFRELTHIDAEKGKTALALGIRDSSIELNVKIKMKDGTEKISIGFPKR